MRAAIAKIQAQFLDTLRRHVPPGSTVALVDFPAHTNAGDSLIYLGELAYLERLGITVGYVASQAHYDEDELRRRVPTGPVLIHGGGNLGDRWLPEQRFRERIVSTLRDRPIIQLPQSVDFTHAAAAEQARAVFDSHPNLTLLLRENQSLARSLQLFPNTPAEFCPDAAFGVGQQRRTTQPLYDVVRLLRKDSEAVPGHDHRLPESLTQHTLDWGRLKGYDQIRWYRWAATGAVSRRMPRLKSPLTSSVMRGYQGVARLNVEVASRELGRGRLVYTNRLHAAVLAGLSGIPVVALDNVYRKVSSVYGEYLHTLGPHVRFAASPDEARDMIAEHFALRRPGTR